jgi:hypothetical protein
MSASLTYQRQGTPTRDQVHTLFAQTMGYVAATAGLFALGAYLDRSMDGVTWTGFSLTGAQVLTVSEAAALISEATGQTITHLDLDRGAWIAGGIANGVAAEYEAVLRPLTETVQYGNGSHPNGMGEQITGTPPRTFRDFAGKNAAAWSEAAT